MQVEAFEDPLLLGAFLGAPAALALLDAHLRVVQHHIQAVGAFALAQLRWRWLEFFWMFLAPLPKLFGAGHLTLVQLVANAHDHPVCQVRAHLETEAPLEERAALLEGVECAQQRQLADEFQ